MEPIAAQALVEQPGPVRTVWDRILRRRRGRRVILQPRWARDAFGDLARGLYLEADAACTKDEKSATTWTRWHYTLGVSGVVLAAIAGFGGLADLLGKQATALTAIAAGVATAVATFLQSDKHRQEHTTWATAWDSFRDDITIIYNTKPRKARGQDGPDGWKAVVEALQDRARALRAHEPDPMTPPRRWP